MKKQLIVFCSILLVSLFMWWIRVHNSLVVHGTSTFGNGVGGATIDGSWVLTFTGIGGFTTPYGMFTQTGTITVDNATLAYPVTYNVTDDVGYGVSLSWGQDIVVPRKWYYEICYSAIADTDSNSKRVFMWVRKNGIDVPNSNTVVQLSTASVETVIALCAIFDMDAWDYLTLMLGSDDAGSRLLTTTGWTNPTRPVSPAIITTIKKITN